MEIVVDVDDLSPVKLGLETLIQMREHYPNFKVTCFTPAMDQALPAGKLKESKVIEWAKLLRQYDWIEIAPHGFLHLKEEMLCDYDSAVKTIKGCEAMFRKLELPFVKIWKSPYWQTSIETYTAMRDHGYVVAVDKNQELPNVPGLEVYIFNKSLEQPFDGSEEDIVKWHGHVGGTFYNDISLCAHSLTTAPVDATFLTISEYLKKYGTIKI